jgi:hypothetical protein
MVLRDEFDVVTGATTSWAGRILDDAQGSGGGHGRAHPAKPGSSSIGTQDTSVAPRFVWDLKALAGARASHELSSQVPRAARA